MESKAQQAQAVNSDSTSFLSELFKLKKTLISCHSIKPTNFKQLDKLSLLLLISYERKFYLRRKINLDKHCFSKCKYTEVYTRCNFVCFLNRFMSNKAGWIPVLNTASLLNQPMTDKMEYST